MSLGSAADDEYCYLIFDNYNSATFIDGAASHDPTTIWTSNPILKPDISPVFSDTVNSNHIRQVGVLPTFV